jgi:steroid 5-alpha reductase family enzyme
VLDLSVQIISSAAAAVVMGVAWLFSLRMRDASVADIAWGLTFVAVAWACLIVGPEAGDRSLLLAALVSIWGLRLAAYIAWRHDGEDRRYVAMRRRYGDRFAVRSLWSVFGLQAGIAWIVSAPIQVAAADGTPPQIGVLGLLGAVVCLAGIACETVADLQLASFLRRPDSGEAVMDSGIWRYSRHPNYFGDACFWWGVWLIALATGSAWWTAIGPALMTLFLLRVSGVALTERTIASRRPGYDEYVKVTSAFVPLPRRRAAGPRGG